MLGRDRLHDSRPDPGSERAGDRLRFADLADYYPAQSPPAQTINGTQPAAPQNAPSASAGSGANAPAVYLILFVVVGLLALHAG